MSEGDFIQKNFHQHGSSAQKSWTAKKKSVNADVNHSVYIQPQGSDLLGRKKLKQCPVLHSTDYISARMRTRSLPNMSIDTFSILLCLTDVIQMTVQQPMFSPMMPSFESPKVPG